MINLNDTWTCPPEEEGCRLDRFLSDRMEDISRAQVQDTAQVKIDRLDQATVGAASDLTLIIAQIQPARIPLSAANPQPIGEVNSK